MGNEDNKEFFKQKVMPEDLCNVYVNIKEDLISIHRPTLNKKDAHFK